MPGIGSISGPSPSLLATSESRPALTPQTPGQTAGTDQAAQRRAGVLIGVLARQSTEARAPPLGPHSRAGCPTAAARPCRRCSCSPLCRELRSAAHYTRSGEWRASPPSKRHNTMRDVSIV